EGDGGESGASADSAPEATSGDDDEAPVDQETAVTENKGDGDVTFDSADAGEAVSTENEGDPPAAQDASVTNGGLRGAVGPRRSHRRKSSTPLTQGVGGKATSRSSNIARVRSVTYHLRSRVTFPVRGGGPRGGD